MLSFLINKDIFSNSKTPLKPIEANYFENKNAILLNRFIKSQKYGNANLKENKDGCK